LPKYHHFVIYRRGGDLYGIAPTIEELRDDAKKSNNAFAEERSNAIYRTPKSNYDVEKYDMFYIRPCTRRLAKKYMSEDGEFFTYDITDSGWIDLYGNDDD
jgi:hypothetical protein